MPDRESGFYGQLLVRLLVSTHGNQTSSPGTQAPDSLVSCLPATEQWAEAPALKAWELAQGPLSRHREDLRERERLGAETTGHKAERPAPPLTRPTQQVSKCV